jgi:hypothetical protein
MNPDTRMTKEAGTPAEVTLPRLCRALMFGAKRRTVASFAFSVATSLLFVSLAANLPSAFAAGEKAPPTLTGKVELRFLRCRSGAPIPIVWEIEWNEQAIAEGVLEYEVEDGNQMLGRFHLPDLVLSPGKNVFNAMLPTLAIYSRSVPVTVRARFVSGKRTFEIEELSLRVPNLFAQWFNVGVVSSVTSKPSREESRLIEAIHWERLIPEELVDSSTTASMDVQTPALPTDPLTLCNFDVVVLLSSSLAELRDDQADALKKWVSAGGSVCLVAGGGLTPRHAVFINQLLDESKGHEVLVVNPHGYLAPGQEFTGEIIAARKGLGRVVVLRQALLASLKPDAQEWLDASAFLMKVRRHPIDPRAENLNAVWMPNSGVVFPGSAMTVSPRKSALPKGSRPQAGTVPAPALKPAPSPNAQNAPQISQQAILARRQRNNPAFGLQYDPNYMMRSVLAPPPFATMSELFQILMPQDVQMVPLGLIGLVLAAYVVAIGPIDYFLLGALKMRRFTWILFPVVTIAFAGFTLWLSRWYLGTNDSRQGIEICDVVKGGIAARRTRVELLFFSRERDLGTEVQNGAFSQVGSGGSSYPRMTLPGANEVTRVNQARFVGRIPSHYVVDEAVPQWTPIVNRFFWIDPKPVAQEKTVGADPDAHFDWDDPGDSTTVAGRTALAARIRKAFGEHACAAVYRSDGENVATPILNYFASMRKLRPHTDSSGMQYNIGDVIREISVARPQKLFSFASQLSPSGSPELEDLALLDGSDPQQSLLVIGVDTGSDLVIYRRLYVGEP